MKLAYIILAHDDADNLFRLIQRLLTDDDGVVGHWDKKNPLDLTVAAAARLDERQRQRVRFARRVAVEWGGWSMVAATLAALEELENSVETFDYVILLSGADYPIKPLATLKAFLGAGAGREYIECVDPEREAWVVDGLVQERYQHYHWFNWRKHPKLFSFAVSIQKRLGIKRRLPERLQPRFGSQWWALTWPTAQQILQRSRRRAIRAFFKTTWVPDELFFPTLAAALTPPERIVSSSLTFYHFSQQGRPLVLYNDHFEFLCQQEQFFARKLSPQASALRDRLDGLIAIPQAPPYRPAKQLHSYEMFIAVQWRGLPGRRIIGRQQDAWYGDLEWNKRPYFVIVCDQHTRLEPLRESLNALEGILCYGELFRGNRIDYALPGFEHPFYPNDKPALRDMKRPNFVADLVHSQPQQVIGFVLRLPCGHEMEKIVVFDPQATLIFILPETTYYPATGSGLDWQNAFANMVLLDNLSEVRRTGKRCLYLSAHQHLIPAESIVQATATISSLKIGFTC
ncbi:MAG: beta-1,6-N-acetylglucosaminyltransferase [Methylovulum sp.]|nr:beta-1,6-N-acetylglucosaminyltransferase [Methylovulum sp.]